MPALLLLRQEHVDTETCFESRMLYNAPIFIPSAVNKKRLHNENITFKSAILEN